MVFTWLCKQRDDSLGGPQGYFSAEKQQNLYINAKKDSISYSYYGKFDSF
jgi:hypothetical protein